MSVANILKTPITAPQITEQYAAGGGGAGVGSINGASGAITIAAGAGISVGTVGSTVTITNTGGGPGLFLPLLGGAMDPFPLGVIDAHTLEEVVTITGSSSGPGNDTVIQTIAGNDLSLQTGTNEDIFINTGQLTITAPTRCEINAITVIQPPGGYTYPNNPEVGLTVKNFINPTGAQQIGCVIDNITSDGQADGLSIFGVKSTVGAGDAYGVRVDAIGDITTTLTTLGMEMNNINGANRVKGIGMTGVTCGIGNATGMEIISVNSGIDGRGILIDGVAAGANGFGIEVNNITSASADCRGIVVAGVQGANSFGLEINSTTGNAGAAVGMIVNGTTATTGGAGAIGAEIGTTTGDGLGIGLQVKGVFASSGSVVGIISDTVSATAPVSNANGLNVGNITSVAGGDARGIQVNAVASSGGGGRSIGMDMVAVNSSFGPAIGVSIASVNTSGPAQANGLSVSNISATAGNTNGIVVNQITGIRTNGIDVVNVVSGAGTANGIRVQGTRSTLPTTQAAYGGFFSRGGLKGANDKGQLLRIADGNLGLAVQTMGPIVNTFFADGGNYVIIEAGAPVNITLQSPPGGFENGHWFMITKIGGGAHTIQNTNVADAFNGQAPNTTFSFGGPSFGKTMMFYNAGIWYANVF